MRFSRSKFFNAIRNQDIDFISGYLELGMDVNLTENIDGGLTPIEFATFRNESEICKVILIYNPNLLITNRLIFWTVHHSNNELFKIYLNKNAPANFIDECLYEACTKDNAFQIKELIKLGANVNYCQSDLTPLHRVARYGNLDSLKLLVENKADINVKDKNSKTPFNYAALYDKFEIVEYLFYKGADTSGVIEKNKFYHVGSHEMLRFYFILLERNPQKLNSFKKELEKTLRFLRGGQLEQDLKVSILNSDLSTFKKIINENKGQLNLNIGFIYKYMENVTPLHLASLMRDYEMVKLLLENGADISCITSNRLDVYYFLECNDPDNSTRKIIKLLKEHEANIDIVRKRKFERNKDVPKRVKTVVEKKDGVIHITVNPIDKVASYNDLKNKNPKNDSGFLVLIKNVFKTK